MVLSSMSLDSQDSTMESSVSQGGIVSGFCVLAAPCAVENSGRRPRRTTWIAEKRILN